MKFALKIGSFFFSKQQQVIKMKIKGVLENLNFFNLKKFNDNSKNTYRTFCGVVVDSVWSVHFHIVT